MNLEAMFMLCMIYFILFCSVLWMLVFFDRRKELSIDPKTKRNPLVSIVIPVYKGDTSAAIKKSVISALAVDYPKKEIILSWNGPESELLGVCKDFEKKGLIKLVKTEKPGKAAGMNEALKHIKGELFCCLDADSFFKPEAVKSMVGYFDEDAKTGAVTSSMKVYEAKTWLQKIQWVEYIFAIYLRRMMASLNCLYVVPGPGSMYRTELIKKIGGFDEHILTEDMEIAFRIQLAGYNIKTSVNAIVDTIAPDAFKPLVKQRIRWYAGFCDTLRKHHSMVLNPKHGMLGMFMLPTSIIWVGIILYGIFSLAWETGVASLPVLKTIAMVGFDWQVLLKALMEFRLLQFSYLSGFGVLFLFIGLFVIKISVELAGEKIDLRNKTGFYALYITTYTFLMGFFWLAALGYLAYRGKNKKALWGNNS